MNSPGYPAKLDAKPGGSLDANAVAKSPGDPGARATTKSAAALPVKPRLPPLKALLAFEAASRHGSFSQGADELSVTSSAVSHQIHLLEEFLGVQLFSRHAGRVALTAAGRTYANEIRHAFGVIAGATSLVAPQSQGGHLVIAAGPSFAAKWLQPRLPDFLGCHAGMRIRLSTLTDSQSFEGNRFDIAISYGRPPSTLLNVQPLLRENLRPLCSPSVAAALSLRTPDDLAKATLIHSINALSWSEYLRRVDLPELKPSNELWLDRSSMAIEAAVNGLGVVLESEILASDELRRGVLVAPFDDSRFAVAVTSYFLARPNDARPTAQIVAFETWLRAEIAAANLTMKTGEN